MSLPFLHRLIGWAGLATARCPVCSRLTHRQEKGVCSECSDKLVARQGGYCTQCGEIFANENEPPMQCGQCRSTPMPWQNLYFHSMYDGPLRELILAYKFRGALGHASLLADMAARTYAQRTDRVPDIIVPVPLHRRRLLWRGFNQSTELSKALGRETGAPVLNAALRRTRYTRPQTRLDISQRHSNIKAAFAAPQDMVTDKDILLVDDVYTTGATLRECARTLMKAGARSIDVFILARAVR